MRVTRLFGFWPALLLCTAPALSASLFFTAPREHPWRLVDGPPPGAAAGEASFEGVARPGEFFVFQIGLVPDAAAGPLAVAFEDLAREGGTPIPAAALRCISLGGVGSDGNPFAKRIEVPAGKLQMLWCGIDVPASAAGSYRGRAAITGGAAPLGSVALSLRVEGDAVADHGDAAAKNLSRLRWLDSNAGREPTLTAPFTPVRVEGRSVFVLGRRLDLGEDGLPAQVTSFFDPSNTRIVEKGRTILAAPFAFVAETAAGVSAGRGSFGALQASDLEATWEARWSSDGLEADVTGRLDYTGSGEVRIALRSSRDIDLADLRLEAPWREDAARYFMGLDRRGGRRPADGVAWRWDVAKRQDCFWLGDVNAGLMLRLKDENFVRPLVNIYYKFLPLVLPASWGNAGKGGVTLSQAKDGAVFARAFSGARSLRASETLVFAFELYLTPFRPLDTEKQWRVRFVHPSTSRTPEVVERTLAAMDPVGGPNVLNVHQAQFHVPYINYPFADDNFPALKDLIARAHAKDVKVRVYYTTRELTQNLPELFALHALNGEVIFPGPGKDARTLINPNGPHPWLVANLGSDFVPAWVDRLGRPGAEWDLSVITRPDSRWNNFYLEGLRWMAQQTDLDGIYVDDTALDAESLRRARRILDTKPGRLIDLHSWNHFNEHAGFANNLTIYMEILPYLDRLWLGEGFNANEAALDYWLVEMSGLPFGLMSEMLDGANPWRGLLFGETARMSWSGDPRPIWKAWDEYGIRGTELVPFFVPGNPVATGRDDVPATVYRGKGRALVALASWAKEPCEVTPQVDWAALGLDPSRAALYAPAIDGVQTERAWKPGEALHVAPGRGYFLVLDETPRAVRNADSAAAGLSEVLREDFAGPALPEGWRVVKSAAGAIELAPAGNAPSIEAPANRIAGLERALPRGVRAVELELNGGTDGGQTWGPGAALVWPNGRSAKVNLRLVDRVFGTFAGDGLRFCGGPIDRAATVAVRIVLGDEEVFFQVRVGSTWEALDRQSRNGLAGDPSAVRIGKVGEDGAWQDFPGEEGPRGKCACGHVRVMGM